MAPPIGAELGILYRLTWSMVAWSFALTPERPWRARRRRKDDRPRPWMPCDPNGPGRPWRTLAPWHSEQGMRLWGPRLEATRRWSAAMRALRLEGGA